MEARREFLKASAAALSVAAAKPLFGFQGANNRIRMAVIGCGTRQLGYGAEGEEIVVIRGSGFAGFTEFSAGFRVRASRFGFKVSAP